MTRRVGLFFALRSTNRITLFRPQPTNRTTPHFALTHPNQTLNSYRNSISSTTLRLFKVVFSSVGVFPENEAILRPHLKLLVKGILGFAGAKVENVAGKPNEPESGLSRFEANMSSSKPNYHYQLIRALFRSISGGKFESSYKELVPLLPGVLNGLYRLYNAEGEVSGATTNCEERSEEQSEELKNICEEIMNGGV